MAKITWKTSHSFIHIAENEINEIDHLWSRNFWSWNQWYTYQLIEFVELNRLRLFVVVAHALLRIGPENTGKIAFFYSILKVECHFFTSIEVLWTYSDRVRQAASNATRLNFGTRIGTNIFRKYSIWLFVPMESWNSLIHIFLLVTVLWKTMVPSDRARRALSGTQVLIPGTGVVENISKKIGNMSLT